MRPLTNKQILLAVTGGIAAYKSAETVRRLRDLGADVKVLMTRGALEFITPLTMQALSGHPVHTDLLDPQAEAAMGHIELARWADLVLVAPASASAIARLAAGRAEDLLGAVWLATQAPTAIAPAMNHQMWADPATRENVQKLAGRGTQVWGPASGDQACGETGAGRLLEAEELASRCAGQFRNGLLQGLQVVITAGPTREAIDPVRYISNLSSGKMGYAIAEACIEAGATVTLISGPVGLKAPDRAVIHKVTSAQEMLDAVTGSIAGCELFIAAAAVADYRPLEVADQKIKKSADKISIELVRNPDILAQISTSTKRPFCIGFAAETDNLDAHAIQKLESKQLDLLIANLVGRKEGGFESDSNAVRVFSPQAEPLDLPMQRKSTLARALIPIVAEAYSAYRKSQD